MSKAKTTKIKTPDEQARDLLRQFLAADPDEAHVWSWERAPLELREIAQGHDPRNDDWLVFLPDALCNQHVRWLPLSEPHHLIKLPEGALIVFGG